MKSRPCCLLVGEDRDGIAFLHFHFARLCPNFRIVESRTGREAVEYCRGNNVELVIAESGLRALDPGEIVAAIRRLHRFIPILVIAEGAAEPASPRAEFTRYLRKRTWSLELGPMLEKLGIFTSLSYFTEPSS